MQMESSLPVFNWSLKRLLASEPDLFSRAKIRILYIMLLFSMLKAAIIIALTGYFHQEFQFERAVGALVCYIVFLKVLLTGRKTVGPLTHLMIWTGLLLVWSNIFLYSGTVNIVTMQFTYMLIVCSFYLLPLRFSIPYSFLAFLPAVLFSVFPGLVFGVIPEKGLGSPAFEIVVVLNFITVIITHYLFRQSFLENLAEKELLNCRLTAALEEARAAADSKSEFLSTMSHELRTPLNSVIAISEMLHSGPDSPEREENLGILKNSAAGLHSLINNILDFSKLGSGKLELEAIPVDMGALFTEVCTGLRLQAMRKQLAFTLHTDEGIPGIRVITDPTRLRQIVYNLVGNAVKFTETGSVTVRLELISVSASGVDLKVSVRDTGIGIAPDRLESIFDPFQQGGAGITRNFGGTGLGLAIVRRLLLAFDSDIHVSSRPGAGSEFWFELSLERAHAPENVEGCPEDSCQALTALKVLVAEDNAMNRVVLSKVLSKWNLVPVFAMNGSEAVERLGREDFDLILMDLHMPEMDGYQAAGAIRKMPDPKKAGVRIIALSASATDTLDAKVRAAGMDDYLLKPFKIAELYEKLKGAAASAALTDQTHARFPGEFVSGRNSIGR